jgi:integrase
MNITKNTLFKDYYANWIDVYKDGAIADVTLKKYKMAHQWICKIVPSLKLKDLDRTKYQEIINEYSKSHEKQTVIDFHHIVKCAILDAVDDGHIKTNPTRKVTIKGKTPTPKKTKYLDQYDLHTLLKNLDLKNEINWDYLILLIAKTGLRFSEALGLTPEDFDFSKQTISVNKTWNYKGDGGFLPTKNKSSVRKVKIDWATASQFSSLIKDLPKNKPIFVKDNEPVFNSTINDRLERYCKKLDIPVISVHGLRHTHASILLFAGVSVASVSRRLGHSNIATTQKTYLHIIQELENQDMDIVMRSISGLA